VITPFTSPIGRPPIAQAPAEGRPRSRTIPANRIAGAPTAQPAASPRHASVHQRSPRPSTSAWSAPGTMAIAATSTIAAATKPHVPRSPPTFVTAHRWPGKAAGNDTPGSPAHCCGGGPPAGAQHAGGGEPLRESDGCTEYPKSDAGVDREDIGSPPHRRDPYVGLLEDAGQSAAQRAPEREGRSRWRGTTGFETLGSLWPALPRVETCLVLFVDPRSRTSRAAACEGSWQRESGSGGPRGVASRWKRPYATVGQTRLPAHLRSLARR